MIDFLTEAKTINLREEFEKILKEFSNHVTKFQKVEMDHSSIASSDVALDS